MSRWTDLIDRHHNAHNLTADFHAALIALAAFDLSLGCFPSHEAVAARAGCCVRTVERAFRHARDALGILDWTERRVKRGWRWLRTSNLYRMIVPATPVARGLRPVWWRRPLPDIFAGGDRQDSKKEAQGGQKAALAAMLDESARLPDLLAARRKVVEAALLTRRLARSH